MLLELLFHKSYFVGATMLQIIFSWNYCGGKSYVVGATVIAGATYIAHGYLTMSLGSDNCGIIVLTIRVVTGMDAYLGTPKYLGIY